jgi:hypothetical protein
MVEYMRYFVGELEYLVMKTIEETNLIDRMK